MASETLPTDAAGATVPEFAHERFEPTTPLGQAIVEVLTPLASLKITVALFALSDRKSTR